MIRLKKGLVKWSNAHKEMAAKSHLLFSATHDIAQLIPDVPNTSEIQVHLFLSFYNDYFDDVAFFYWAKHVFKLSSTSTSLT